MSNHPYKHIAGWSRLASPVAAICLSFLPFRGKKALNIIVSINWPLNLSSGTQSIWPLRQLPADLIMMDDSQSFRLGRIYDPASA